MVADTPNSEEIAFNTTDVELLQFNTAELIEATKSSRRFRVHLAIGLIITLINLGLWLLLDFFDPVFPWFIYPATLFATTLLFHFYICIRPKELLQFHVGIYIILNSMLFLTWLFVAAAEDETFEPWFLYPMFGLLIPLSMHYAAVKYRHEHKWIKVHMSFFASTNLFCIMAWFDGAGYPWWIITLFALGLPLVIHYALHYHKGNGFMLHALIFADVQLLLFFIWAASMVFPFFVFPLVIWGLVLLGHYRKHSKSSRASNGSTSNSAPDVLPTVTLTPEGPNETTATPPAVPTQSLTQVNMGSWNGAVQPATVVYLYPQMNPSNNNSYIPPPTYTPPPSNS